MLDVLLVRIQPTDRSPEDFEYFDEETVDFKIPVLNGDPLHFKFSKEYYFSELVVLDLEFFIFSDFTAHTFGEKLREDIFMAVVVFIARLCEIQGGVCC